MMPSRSRVRPDDLAVFAVLAVATAILLIPFRGAIPSIVMSAITVVAGLAIVLDRRVVRAMGRRTRWLIALVAGLLAWQMIGVLVRTPFSTREFVPLGWTLAIGSFLFLSALALRSPQPASRLLMPLFVLGVVSSVVSLILFARTIGQDPDLIHALRSNRLVPFGRASHAIIGGGGLAAAFFAGAFLWGQGGRTTDLVKGRRAVDLRAAVGHPLVLMAGLGLVLLTMLLTQSRGPLLALLLALAALAALRAAPPSWRPAAALGLGLFCFLVPVGLVLAEPLLFKVFCAKDAVLCRPSMRQEVWSAVAGMIAEHPLLGYGASRRLDELSVHHPHNGLLGTAFYFGLPAALLLVGAFGLALTSAARAAAGPWRNFALAGLFFAAGFLGTDFSNPFAFFNTHYLFIWLPMVAAVVAADQQAVPEQGGTVPGENRPLEQGALVKPAP